MPKTKTSRVEYSTTFVRSILALVCGAIVGGLLFLAVLAIADSDGQILERGVPTIVEGLLPFSLIILATLVVFAGPIWLFFHFTNRRSLSWAFLTSFLALGLFLIMVSGGGILSRDMLSGWVYLQVWAIPVAALVWRIAYRSADTIAKT